MCLRGGRSTVSPQLPGLIITLFSLSFYGQVATFIYSKKQCSKYAVIRCDYITKKIH